MKLVTGDLVVVNRLCCGVLGAQLYPDASLILKTSVPAPVFRLSDVGLVICVMNASSMHVCVITPTGIGWLPGGNLDVVSSARKNLW